MSAIEKENHYREVLYLGQKREAYGPFGLYAKGNSPDDRIEALLAKEGSLAAREKLLKNVRRLEAELAKLPEDVEDFDQVLRQIILGIAIESQSVPQDVLEGLDSTGGLFLHLDEATHSTVSFYDNIEKSLEGRMGQLLTPRQFQLMEFVAKTHDLAKLLGGFNAQIDPDHEVIYREVIGKYLKGKRFKSSRGEITLGDDKRDLDFVIGLAGFHEDIWREDSFAGQISSLKQKINPAEDVDTAIERSRMLFHFIDIFGDSIGFVENKRGEVSLRIRNKKAFADRFIDLYRRHINLPINIPGKEKESKHTNWPRAKVYRPEWGLHGVAGLTWTFEALREGWGIKVDQALIAEVQLGILRVMQEAIQAAGAVLENQQTEYRLVVPDGTEPYEERKNATKELLQSRFDHLVTTWVTLSNEITESGR